MQKKVTDFIVNLKDLDIDLVKGLTEFEYGGMAELLASLEMGFKRRGWACLVRETEIVGWGALVKRSGQRGYNLMIYVKPEFRRRKIGSMIYKKLASIEKNIVVSPHDEVSEKFFNFIESRFYEK